MSIKPVKWNSAHFIDSETDAQREVHCQPGFKPRLPGGGEGTRLVITLPSHLS